MKKLHFLAYIPLPLTALVVACTKEQENTDLVYSQLNKEIINLENKQDNGYYVSEIKDYKNQYLMLDKNNKQLIQTLLDKISKLSQKIDLALAIKKTLQQVLKEFQFLISQNEEMIISNYMNQIQTKIYQINQALHDTAPDLTIWNSLYIDSDNLISKIKNDLTTLANNPVDNENENFNEESNNDNNINSEEGENPGNANSEGNQNLSNEKIIFSLNNNLDNINVELKSENVTYNDLKENLVDNISISTIPSNVNLIMKGQEKTGYFAITIQLKYKENPDLFSKVKTVNVFPKLNEDQVKQYYIDNPTVLKYQESKPNIPTEFKNNKDYIDDILSRSFSLRWSFKDGTWTGGTAWLLDYHKTDENKYSLFLATNYHVAVDLYRDDDQEIYYQNKRVNSNPINEFLISFDLKNSQSNEIKNLANKYKFNKDFAYRMLKGKAIPKVLFLAQNFMDSHINDEGNNYYSDFAVIQWDVDLSKQLTLEDLNLPSDYSASAKQIELKNKNIEWALMVRHIKGAINNLNNSYQKFVKGQNEYLMNNKTIPYATLPYYNLSEIRRNFFNKVTPEPIYESPFNKRPDNVLSINQLSDLVNEYLGDYKYAYNINAYLAGFSLLNGVAPKTLTNITPGQEEKLGFKEDEFNRPVLIVDKTYNNKRVADHGTAFNLNEKSLFYGIALKYLALRRGKGGMSGSMVVNEENLPFGIFFGNTNGGMIIDSNHKYVSLASLLIAPFSQEISFWENGLKVDKYNLIDGTDKQKYPHQIHSYRERLQAIYGNDYETLLYKKSQ
ncbi:MIP family Ig-specific serine endopeptidase [Metamycoplasma neophronis]|uniref:DUF31 domain-containing protein n=1 Tax=Metamycoplasma neophronis TaxID=872983 RepID=A0ABY2YZY7_9BACT|nr:hypothetical protein [Metamycoplasma neophronis]TPR54054.1 hypothetical protein FJR74_01265 [Metamycoplasma neophronis]